MSDLATGENSPADPSVVRRPVAWNRVAREFDWISRLIIGGIFIWSGSAHLANPYYFMSTIYQYELTSAAVGVLIASYLPFLELLLAMCLLSGTASRAAWLVTSILLMAFVGVQGSALSRGLTISCGCFGPEINRPIDATSITFTAALAVLAICAAIADRRAQRVQPIKPVLEVRQA